MAISITTLGYIGAFGFILYILYMRFIKGSHDCKVTVWEQRNNVLIKHDKDYKGFIRKINNETRTETLRWLFVEKLKINFIPITKDYNITLKGKKNICLVWSGGNNVRIIKPSQRKVKNIRKFKEKLFTCEYINEPSLPIYPARLDITSADIQDKLERLYNTKKWWDDFKPHIMLATLGIFCLLLVYITTKEVSKSREESNSWLSKFVDATTNFQKQDIDENTVMVQKSPVENKGGG